MSVILQQKAGGWMAIHSTHKIYDRVDDGEELDVDRSSIKGRKGIKVDRNKVGQQANLFTVHRMHGKPHSNVIILRG